MCVCVIPANDNSCRRILSDDYYVLSYGRGNKRCCDMSVRLSVCLSVPFSIGDSKIGYAGIQMLSAGEHIVSSRDILLNRRRSYLTPENMKLVTTTW